jgi:hypothetical protein
MKIERHITLSEFYKGRLEFCEKLIDVKFTQMEKSIGEITGLYDGAKDGAAYLSLFEPQSPKIFYLLEMAAEASSALFQMGVSSSETITITIGERSFTTKPYFNESTVHVRAWIDAFFLAAIVRRDDLSDILCEVDIELLRKSSTKGEEYCYSYVDFLKAVHQKRELSQLLKKTIEDTDPSMIKYDLQFALHTSVQEMGLFLNLYNNDETGFNKRLEKALLDHKKIWSMKKNDRNINPDGFLAIGPLAIAGMAFQKGFNIEVESDYTPRFIIDGDFEFYKP